MWPFSVYSFCVLLMWSVSAVAVGTLKDCYAESKLQSHASQPEKSTIVLLDETTIFDDLQRHRITDQLIALIQPRTEIKIFSFSAYIGGRYAQPLLDLSFSAPIDEKIRDTIRKPSLAIFDSCMRTQKYNAESLIRRTLTDYYKRSSDKIAKSDIVGTVRDVGASVMSKVSARVKRVLLVSDMLENSDITSFYSKGSVRRIDAKKELTLVEARGMLTDLRDARVFVIGAGIIHTDPSKPNTDQHRDQGTLQALREFWSGYFEKSNARLVEFGQPLLLQPIGDR